VSNVIIGIDNGISGALVAISAHNGALIASTEMPIQKARKGNEIDAYGVKEWILSVCGECPPNVKCAIVEEPGGSKSARAAMSMSGSFHAIRAVLSLMLIRTHRITPQKWQKEMIPGCKSGDTKPRALELAKRLWPDETFLASPRCRVPNHNIVDAALIAEYARIKQL
jgi:hypothetical protein